MILLHVFTGALTEAVGYQNLTCYLDQLPCQLLQLPCAQLFGINCNATLSSTKWDIHDRCFPSHQTRKTAQQGESAITGIIMASWCLLDRAAPAYIIQIHLWMVSQATLVGTPAIVMLNAVCVEALNLTVILSYDKLHQDFSLRRQKQSLQLLGILELLESLRCKRSVCWGFVLQQTLLDQRLIRVKMC